MAVLELSIAAARTRIIAACSPRRLLVERGVETELPVVVPLTEFLLRFRHKFIYDERKQLCVRPERTGESARKLIRVTGRSH